LNQTCLIRGKELKILDQEIDIHAVEAKNNLAIGSITPVL
jgi:hypothetical protein